MLLKRSTILFVLLVLLVAMTAASASAVSASPVNKADKTGITLSFDKGLKPGIIVPMSSQGSITQGETQWRTKDVSGYTTSLSFGLSWGNPSNSLRMRIYAPNGAIYGPFYDNVDGRIDGFISVTLTQSNGLPQGTYYIEIYGDRVNGQQSYTLY